MPLTDFYELRDFQELGGQVVLNVYHYRVLEAGGPATTIAQAFIDTVFPLLLPLQIAGLTRSFIEVQNLGDPFDFATLTTTAFPGTGTGMTLTSLIAATIQLNRTRTDIKNGMKRFAVGNEASIAGNEWTASFLTDLQAFADVLVQPLELAGFPGIARAAQVVLKRFCKTLPSPPCLSSYVLPRTDTEIDENFYAPLTATARATVRSQVSRKRLV